MYPAKKYAYLADSILRSILLHFMRKRTEEKVNSQRFRNLHKLNKHNLIYYNISY